MSLLPQYQRLPDTQVSPGEFTSSKDTRLSFEDDDPHPPTYPPQPRAGSSTEGHPRPSVVYSFVARYPIKAHNQDVVGVLMPNRAETTAFVQRCLPICAEYPPERIEFLIPVLVTDGNMTRERWALVMDEAWESFDRTPPARLKVQIMDGPGDADRRFWRHVYIGVGIALLVIALFLSIIITMISLSNTDD
ncbi:hypothetical protein EHS25_007861 [Saitozyma podzolica]|uniref:Uncharacterized protein n=1 Tax=Saitozyma podzolica TaxID=1890683 RepID=A0A427YR09_9TREE|nr:hypothetical protein EHS25_007861 [Saitozyma podzolica]